MRGVSLLIGAIILTGITFTLAIMVSSWMKSLAKEEAEKTEKHAGLECSYATLSADEVIYYESIRQLKIKVRASGSVAVGVEKVIAYNDTSTKTYLNGVDFNLATLEPGDAYYIFLSNVPANLTEVRIIPNICKMNALRITEDEITKY